MFDVKTVLALVVNRNKKIMQFLARKISGNEFGWKIANVMLMMKDGRKQETLEICAHLSAKQMHARMTRAEIHGIAPGWMAILSFPRE